MSESIERFQIHIEEEVLVDLRQRLARTRWPDQIEGSGWDYGTDRAYLMELCEY
ncbi:MAG: epoxide hydrolase N-terminal domain-containing protein, partial [Myxococcota bacterium]